jgi:hypothetical protein
MPLNAFKADRAPQRHRILEGAVRRLVLLPLPDAKARDAQKNRAQRQHDEGKTNPASRVGVRLGGFGHGRFTS